MAHSLPSAEETRSKLTAERMRYIDKSIQEAVGRCDNQVKIESRYWDSTIEKHLTELGYEVKTTGQETTTYYVRW